MGFRPETDEQEKLIKQAQAATGIKMSDLLRRAVLMGLPSVVSEVQRNQAKAFDSFEQSLRETGHPAADSSIKRKKIPA